MEFVALLTAAKEMGFEAGHIVSLIIMYFMLRRDLMKVFDKKFSELIVAIVGLKEAHLLEKLETNKRFETIEAHVGINKNKGV